MPCCRYCLGGYCTIMLPLSYRFASIRRVVEVEENTIFSQIHRKNKVRLHWRLHTLHKEVETVKGNMSLVAK